MAPQRPPETPPLRSLRFESEEPSDSDATLNGSPVWPISPVTPATPVSPLAGRKYLPSSPLHVPRHTPLVVGPQIGKGAFSRIFRAVSPDSGVVYAVKTRISSTPPEIFSRERDILRLLSHPSHPHIARYYPELRTSDGNVDDQLVLELYDTDLASYMKSLAPAPQTPQSPPSIDDMFALMRTQSKPIGGEERWNAFSRQLVSALLYMQQHRVIHGDIKPENIMIRVDSKSPGIFADRLVLVDFSSAQIAIPRDQPVVVACSPIYSAPEIRYGGPPSYGSDVYATGLVLAFCATAEEPFSAAKNPQQRLVWMDRVHPLDSYVAESQQRFREVRPILDLFLNRAPLAEIMSKLDPGPQLQSPIPSVDISRDQANG